MNGWAITLAALLLVGSVACDYLARRHYDHGKTHELAARMNPDRIAAVATDLIGATKSYRAAHERQVWAYGLLAAALGVVIGAGGVL